jgi:hypothetical protein
MPAKSEWYSSTEFQFYYISMYYIFNILETIANKDIKKELKIQSVHNKIDEYKHKMQ